MRDERGRAVFHEDMMSVLTSPELSLYVSVLVGEDADDAKMKNLTNHASTTCNGVAGEVAEFWNHLKDTDVNKVGLCFFLCS